MRIVLALIVVVALAIPAALVAMSLELFRERQVSAEALDALPADVRANLEELLALQLPAHARAIYFDVRAFQDAMVHVRFTVPCGDAEVFARAAQQGADTRLPPAADFDIDLAAPWWTPGAADRAPRAVSLCDDAACGSRRVHVRRSDTGCDVHIAAFTVW